jgi:hypothetical protein
MTERNPYEGSLAGEPLHGGELAEVALGLAVYQALAVPRSWGRGSFHYEHMFAYASDRKFRDASCAMMLE